MIVILNLSLFPILLYLGSFNYRSEHINLLSFSDLLHYPRISDSNAVKSDKSEPDYQSDKNYSKYVVCICSTIGSSNLDRYGHQCSQMPGERCQIDPGVLQYLHTLIWSRPSDNPEMSNFDHLVVSHLSHYLSSEKLYIIGDGCTEQINM